MSQEKSEPIFELRQYQIFEGQMDRWVEFMDTVLIPFQRSKGMVVVGSWHVPETNQYVWIRRFDSELDRKRLYKAAYENDFWLNEAKAIVGEMVNREAGLDIKDMHPSPLSILR